ncbi:hypothetical protein ABJI51_02475 [Amycolatopsis sp. NEAU-NG30]|jgi:hypothetical protein|uniref:Secreted protein n=1 Tax=Amycolatopsis melonis TaxID=3156488 RepID=A0ABV0L6K0_9PSEU
MYKPVLRGAAATAVAGTALLLAPQAALAEPKSATCPQSYCSVVQVDGFPGGTLSVDADVHGEGKARFQVWGPNGYYCTLTFEAAAGPGSWLCFNAPAGRYAASVEGPQGSSNIGLRW